jgi:hypothetical protein
MVRSKLCTIYLMSDNRGWLNHRVHQQGHEYNATRKEEGKSGVETWGVYRSYSPNKGPEPGKGKEWDVKVDQKQA